MISVGVTQPGVIGSDGHAVFHTPGYHFVAIAGGDDELGTALHGLFALLQSNNGAGAHYHLGALLGYGGDGIRGSGGAEGNLHHIHAASQQGLGSGNRVLCLIQHHYGHDARVTQFFNNIHRNVPLISGHGQRCCQRPETPLH